MVNMAPKQGNNSAIIISFWSAQLWLDSQLTKSTCTADG